MLKWQNPAAAPDVTWMGQQAIRLEKEVQGFCTNFNVNSQQISINIITIITTIIELLLFA